MVLLYRRLLYGIVTLMKYVTYIPAVEQFVANVNTYFANIQRNSSLIFNSLPVNYGYLCHKIKLTVPILEKIEDRQDLSVVWYQCFPDPVAAGDQHLNTRKGVADDWLLSGT